MSSESSFLSSSSTTTTSSSSSQNNLNKSLIFSILCKRKSNMLRIIVLFLMGSSLCLVLNILQMEYKSNLFPSNVLMFLQTLWWVIPLGGMAAIYIGFSYPFFDHKFGQCHRNDRDSSHIIRSFTMFIGLNHLCAKIQFANLSHFLMILILFCLLFWYWFDKTKFGLIFNIINAVSVLLVAHFLRYIGLFNYNQIQFDYLQICLLCLSFSGGVTFGNFGRILDYTDAHHISTEKHLHSE